MIPGNDLKHAKSVVMRVYMLGLDALADAVVASETDSGEDVDDGIGDVVSRPVEGRFYDSKITLQAIWNHVVSPTSTILDKEECTKISNYVEKGMRIQSTGILYCSPEEMQSYSTWGRMALLASYFLERYVNENEGYWRNYDVSVNINKDEDPVERHLYVHCTKLFAYCTGVTSVPVRAGDDIANLFNWTSQLKIRKDAQEQNFYSAAAAATQASSLTLPPVPVAAPAVTRATRLPTAQKHIWDVKIIERDIVIHDLDIQVLNGVTLHREYVRAYTAAGISPSPRTSFCIEIIFDNSTEQAIFYLFANDPYAPFSSFFANNTARIYSIEMDVRTLNFSHLMDASIATENTDGSGSAIFNDFSKDISLNDITENLYLVHEDERTKISNYIARGMANRSAGILYCHPEEWATYNIWGEFALLASYFLERHINQNRDQIRDDVTVSVKNEYDPDADCSLTIHCAKLFAFCTGETSVPNIRNDENANLFAWVRNLKPTKDPKHDTSLPSADPLPLHFTPAAAAPLPLHFTPAATAPLPLHFTPAAATVAATIAAPLQPAATPAPQPISGKKQAGDFYERNKRAKAAAAAGAPPPS